MKTNIKLRVTPEQSEAVQKICKDVTLIIHETEGYYEGYLKTLTPLTNDEIEGLKQ